MAKVRLPRRKKKRRTGRVGAPPGALEIDPNAPKPVLRAIAYGPDELEEHEVTDLAQLDALEERFEVLWLDVVGLGDAAVLQRLGERYALHPLALEDVIHVHQRPKLERCAKNHFLVMRMMRRPKDGLDAEQLSLFLCEGGVVVSFQEREGDVFEPVRDRLRRRSGRIRQRGADYLAYALVDAVVDAVFPVLESIGDELEELEGQVLEDPTTESLQRIQGFKRELAQIRRMLWPLREALNQLQREEPGRFTEDTLVYLRDCVDHTVQLVDLVESHREIGNGLMDLYMTGVSNRMNEIMKLLTIISTIFIPLSFLAGLYGMNFDTGSPWNMPELGWRYGYPFTIGLMVAIGAGMLSYFRRKRWL